MSVSPVIWPTLKKAGYSPAMAAGLISAGGIGAVLSPPLMGAAAFLIMQFLNTSFWDVVVMVIVPTLLYYMGTLFMVELEARKYNFVPPESPGKTAAAVLRTRGYHLLSLIVLVILLVMGRSPESAAIWAIAATVLSSFLSPDRNEWLLPRRIIQATVEGARNMLPVAALLAAAGVIVGTFSLTGLGLKISSLIMSLSGGSHLLALLLALVASMIIGLSLPITATYIMTVVMVAPALVKVGIPMHVAHLLAFYFAVLSEVSPSGGSLAVRGSGGHRRQSLCGHDARLEVLFAGLSCPLPLRGDPDGANLLIVQASWPGFLDALFTSSASLFFLSVGIAGFFRSPIKIVERVLLMAGAVWMVPFPIGLSIEGLLPLFLGAFIVTRNELNFRRERSGTVSG